MNPSVDPLVGQTVAHYEILARLGGGGMGIVYQGRDTRLGRIVALKFLPQQWSHDEDAKQRFLREAQAASATEHRNICTIHEVATTHDGQLFIVMAYYAGQTLKQRLESGALPIDEALEIAMQVADGLARAHAQGVVHRDIKPGNLILAEDGVRIVDFGLATFADALQLTVPGSTLGTAPYMSPEQVRGDTADARTDVWAAGVILYQMLAGRVPFQGAYAEAIAYAIRHETPAPLRAARPEVSEEVEQLVFRALHKDPGVRFASGRELARALRQVRGQTLPIDLRTVPVVTPAGAVPPKGRRRWRKPLWLSAAAIVVAILAGTAWMTRPPLRPTIAVVPVSNQTGQKELDPYQRALTLALIDALSSSPFVRPVSWVRSLQHLRRFETQLASVVATDALAQAQGVQTLVVPTLFHENQQWRIRIEIRDAASVTTIHTYDSPPVVSSLIQKTAYALMFEGARLVEDHFGRRNPRRWFGRAPSPELATLDAMKAFEQGINLYDEQEYAPAQAAFAEAARLDRASVVAEIWHSRAALSMRDRPAAAAAATAVERLLAANALHQTRLMAEAVVAEARGDDSTAAQRWRDLIEAAPDEPAWVLELAMFEDRRADTREGWSVAVARYRDGLSVDPASIRPHLELCRLYNRLQQGPNALKEGRVALAGYRTAGWRGGESQAMFCLVEALRSGSPEEVAEAKELADRAHEILASLGFSYNLPRAVYYQGLAVGAQGNLDAAAALWRSALEAAETVGNRPLQPIVLNNLGVSNNRLGQVDVAAELFSRSAALYEAMGEEGRAARQQFNRAVLRINYGIEPQQAFRDIQNALGVVRNQGDVDFEVGCREVLGMFHREAMQYTEASRQLNLAMTLAKEHKLEPRIAAVTVQIAALAFEQADYVRARQVLEEFLSGDPGPSATRGRILLGRVETRLGNFEAAAAHLQAALSDVSRQDANGVRPFLDLTLGELAYEQGQDVEARKHFQRTAFLPAQRYAEAASVEAAAYAGLLEGLHGEFASGLALVEASVARAHAMEHVALETKARLLLAQLDVLAGRGAAARMTLEAVADDGPLNLELQAVLHHWRGRAVGAGGAGDHLRATAVFGQLEGRLPEVDRVRMSRRRVLRDIVRGPMQMMKSQKGGG